MSRGDAALRCKVLILLGIEADLAGIVPMPGGEVELGPGLQTPRPAVEIAENRQRLLGEALQLPVASLLRIALHQCGGLPVRLELAVDIGFVEVRALLAGEVPQQCEMPAVRAIRQGDVGALGHDPAQATGGDRLVVGDPVGECLDRGGAALAERKRRRLGAEHVGDGGPVDEILRRHRLLRLRDRDEEQGRRGAARQGTPQAKGVADHDVATGWRG